MMLLWKIKMLLGINEADMEKDDLLETLIEMCKDFAANYCGAEYVQQMDNAVVQMVVYRYGKLGTEGMTSESYNGASFSYADDYPAEVYKALDNVKRICRKARFV